MKFEKFCIHAPQSTAMALRASIVLLFGPVVVSTASQEPLTSLTYLAAGIALWLAIRPR
jgi:hypothetical protein